MICRMKPNLAQMELTRKRLQSDLLVVRRSSMLAGNRGDFRTVGKLTLEAARINQAIAELEAAELSAL